MSDCACVLSSGTATYRQQEIDNVHQTQHHVGDVVEAVDIRGTQQRARDQVVRQHLVVVFPPLLDVDNEDLLNPERQLHEQIPLHLGCHLPRRPVRPDRLEAVPVVGVGPEVLSQSALLYRSVLLPTHHAISPKAAVVDQQPGLLRKPHRRLPLQTGTLRPGAKDPINEYGANSGEAENGADDEVNVVFAVDVESRARLVVGHFEKGSGIGSKGGIEIVHCQQRREDRQGNACKEEPLAICFPSS